MENSIQLEWKEYKVDVNKIHSYFKFSLSNNYDGLICNSEFIKVMFKSNCLSDDNDIVNIYWNSITSTTFNPTMQEIVTNKINDAIAFGNQLIIAASVENVLLGITQAGKTKEVSDFLNNMQVYLRSGSLYAAIDEINNLLESDLPSELSTYVSIARLNEYKTKIRTFLGI